MNEALKSISLSFVAEELQHKMPLVPKDVISQVLTGFSDVAARMMAEGFAIQYTNTAGDVLWRMYTDARLKCQSINLAKAKELMPGVVTDEASMVAHAGELVSLAGVQLRPYLEVQQKFHELLQDYKPKYEVKGTVERAYVAKNSDDDNDNDVAPADSTPSQQGGSSSSDSDDGGNGNE